MICHEDQVLEVYHVDIENKVEEADHVKTNDETIKPENLRKDDKKLANGGALQLAEVADEADIVVGSNVGDGDDHWNVKSTGK